MTTIGAIFTSTCHTKQLNPWPNSSASRVVILSRLSACQGKMGPFKDYPSTRGRQTGLRKRPEWKQTVQLSAVVNTYPVGVLMQLTDGDEKCVLKLCVYKTPFGKSGHIYNWPKGKRFCCCASSPVPAWVHMIYNTVALNIWKWNYV